MAERNETSTTVDITNTYTWADLARFHAPLGCEVSHLTEEDYKDVVDGDGVPCRRAEHHFVDGTLTAHEDTFHWRFEHPGLKDGSISIHAFNCDTHPGYSSVHIRVPVEQAEQ